MKRLTYFLFLIIALSCHQHVKEVLLNEDLIVVDIDQSDSLRNVPYSTFFSDIKIVPLEFREDCIIGQIDFIEFIGDTLLIKDGKFHSLYLFSYDGKFLNSLGSIGKGPGEFLRPDYVTYDKVNKEVYVFDQTLQKICIYSLDGSHIREIFLKQDIRITGIAISNDKIFVNELPFPSSNEKDHYLIRTINDNGLSENKWLKNRGIPLTLTYNIKGSLYENSRGIIFNQDFLDTIFLITNHEIAPYIYVKSSKELSNSPHNINSNKELVKRGIRFEDGIGIEAIYNYLENDRFIYFECRNGRKGYSIVMEKGKNILLASSLYDDITFSFDNWRAVGINDQYMVREIMGNYLLPDITQDLSGFYDDAINNKINISTNEIKKIEEIINIDHNPVLIFYKFKDSFYD